MADIMDRATRSRVMSRIRSGNTKPEMAVRRLLHGAGFRYRLQVKSLPGRPDIVLPKHHALVFVHGCFWHGHDCPAFRLPSSRRKFWKEKIRRNRERDTLAECLLREGGWRVALVWECALRGRGQIASALLERRLTAWLHGSRKRLEIRGRAKT